MELMAQWASYWPGIDVAALARDVEARWEAAVRAWELRDARVAGGGNVALVGTATWRGRPVVLKVNPRGHPDDAVLAAGATALRFWRKTGAAVELLAARDDDFTVLLERLGAPLDDAGLERRELLTMLGGLAARLHACGPPPPGIPHIGGDYARDWRRVLAGRRELDELEALLVPSDDDVLIHADLHGANALRDGDTWKVIDPHAVRADRHADVWALIDPLAPVATRELVEVYARAAGLDVERALAWTRLRALAGSLEDDDGWARRLARTAEALAP